LLDRHLVLQGSVLHGVATAGFGPPWLLLRKDLAMSKPVTLAEILWSIPVIFILFVLFFAWCMWRTFKTVTLSP
jgi:uncharacterized membrane protein